MKGKIRERVYPVGRLDFGSEGLIILTNDGELTRFLTKAGNIKKVYRVKVAGEPAERDLDRLRGGAYIDNERSEEHTSELQSHSDLVCRLLLEKKKKKKINKHIRHTQ